MCCVHVSMLGLARELGPLIAFKIIGVLVDGLLSLLYCFNVSDWHSENQLRLAKLYCWRLTIHHTLTVWLCFAWMSKFLDPWSVQPQTLCLYSSYATALGRGPLHPDSWLRSVSAWLNKPLDSWHPANNKYGLCVYTYMELSVCVTDVLSS